MKASIAIFQSAVAQGLADWLQLKALCDYPPRRT